MQQTIEVTNFKIPIPENSVIVQKSEYEKLLENELAGQTWGMKDLRKRLNNASPDWIKSNILIPFRKELEYKGDTGFIVYARGTGTSYQINARKMVRWLDDNWALYMKGR